MLWESDSDLDKLTAALETHDKSATHAIWKDLIARILQDGGFPPNPAEEATFRH
jgi:hypothetical protein